MTRQSVTAVPEYAERILLLKDQLRDVQKQSEELSAELENPSSKVRYIFKSGYDNRQMYKNVGFEFFKDVRNACKNMRAHDNWGPECRIGM